MKLTPHKTLTLIILLLLNGCGSGQKNTVSEKEIKLDLGQPAILENKKCGAYEIRFINNKTIVTTGSRTVCIWDVEKGKILKTFNIKASGLAVSPDGKYLGLGLKNKAALFDIKKGKIIKYFPGHRDWVESCVFHPGGNYFVTGAGVRLRFWEMNTGKKIATIKVQNGVKDLLFNSKGDILIYGTIGKGKNFVTLYDFKKKKPKHSIDTPGPNTSISVFENYFNNSKIIIATSTYYWEKYRKTMEFEVQIWDPINKIKKQTLKDTDKRGYTEYVESLDFHPTGKLIATGSQEGIINIYSIIKGYSVFRYDIKFNDKIKSSTIYSVKFSKYGKFLTAGTKNNILVWKITGEIK
jgi:WD40 repeat protein